MKVFKNSLVIVVLLCLNRMSFVESVQQVTDSNTREEETRHLTEAEAEAPEESSGGLTPPQATICNKVHGTAKRELSLEEKLAYGACAEKALDLALELKGFGELRVDRSSVLVEEEKMGEPRVHISTIKVTGEEKDHNSRRLWGPIPDCVNCYVGRRLRGLASCPFQENLRICILERIPGWVLEEKKLKVQARTC